jgi:poly(3-hydroxybutyrate) depolymerase
MSIIPFLPSDNAFLYTIYDNYKQSLLPLSLLSNVTRKILENNRFIDKEFLGTEAFIASFVMLNRLTMRYTRPNFNINETLVDNVLCNVYEDTLFELPFCHLLHFRKDCSKIMPKILLIPPLAGHHPTLIRNTVKSMLPKYDVYVPNWLNARDIPITKGYFDLNDCINYIIRFVHEIGDGVKIMSICQSTIPALVATAYMCKENLHPLPTHLIVMGGPIDTRQSPTSVNSFANHKDVRWFADYLISRVPLHYDGYGRRVYPGFLQLLGFISMNARLHIGHHFQFYKNLIAGDEEKTSKHMRFYDEYLSAMDLPAEFYIQTINTVFKEHLIPRHKILHNAKKVDFGSIKNTKVLAIEGERDDICGIGQTKAVFDICFNLPEENKFYHLQKDVGHYGLFNGKKFNQNILPIIDQFILRNSSESIIE